MRDPRTESGYLGGVNLPTDGPTGWHGWWGYTPIQGPPPAPEGYVVPPRPEERALHVHIQTDWTCPFCQADNDVWGVADGEWMECSECGRESYVLFT